ncbi:MAG: efflux RND transporter periplasmic adaptor subunit [Gemmatimonadales bacterium]|jgi:HlyD family secretion protein
MNKKIIIGAGLLVVVAVVTVGFLSRGHSTYSATYRFVTVDRGDISAAVNSTGTLGADTTVAVGAQVSGLITQLFADYNSHVKKGQLMARLDPRPAELEVRTAQAAVAQDVADSMLKSFTLTQATPLHANGMMTDNDFVAAQAAFEQSKANLQSARVQLARAQQDLAYTYIYAPIDGVVQERDVQVGQTVASSFAAPQLFVIASDLRKMQILVQVDEADIGQIKAGQDVQFTVEAFPNRVYHGTVATVRLQYATVQNVVDYTVVVAVSNPDATLLPGMTATVNFQTAKAANVLRVQNAALRFRPSAAMLAAADIPQRRGGAGAGGADTGSARRQFTAADSARFRQMMAQRGAQGGGQGGVGGGAGGAGAAGGAGGAGQGGGAFGGGQRPGGAGSQGAGMTMPGGMGFGGATNVVVLWTVDSLGKPAPVRVHTGLSDGQLTEITGSALKEGMKIIAAVTNEKAGGASNPFQAQQQQGGPGRRVL